MLRYEKVTPLSSRDRQSAIQANGSAAERLAEGLLGSYFTVLRLNIDRDGVDLMLEPMPQGPFDLRRREVSGPNFAIIQSKYFERGRSVPLELGQATEGNNPRPHYFVMLHTRSDDGEPIRYFLSSADVISLPNSKRKGFKIFSITKGDSKDRFQISVKDIINCIKQGMSEFERLHYSRLKQKAWDEVRHFFTYRTASKARDPKAEYHLVNVDLKKRRNVTGFSEAKVVLARSPTEPIARAIDARWDRIDTPSTWAWGYSGSGPRLLAVSILAHYFGREVAQPFYAEAEAFTYSIISNLKEDRNHVITGYKIDRFLKTFRMSASDRLSDT